MDERSNRVVVTVSVLQPIIWNRDNHDPISAGVSIDFARIAEKPNVEAYDTYVLRQISYNMQWLIPTAESAPTSYSIKHHTTGGFVRKQPHIVVTRDVESRGTRLAEVWFGTHGYGSKIVYIDVGTTQHLARDNLGQ